jgi:hypothetical protein
MLERGAGIITDEQYQNDRRRVPAHEKKSWTLKNMQDIHHQIKRQLFLGITCVDIAKNLGIDKQTVMMIKNSPIIQQQLKVMHGAADSDTIDLQKQIAEILPKALANLREVIETGQIDGEQVSASVRLKESNAILDRGVGKAAQTINTTSVSTTFTADDILKLKQQACEGGGHFDDGEVIDLTEES